MSAVLKPTVNNIVSLWFGADTPLRHYKISLNADLWQACQHTSQHFTAPSKVKNANQYRNADKLAFARAVLQELDRSKFPTDTKTRCRAQPA